MTPHEALSAYREAHPKLSDDELAQAYNAETVTVRQPLVPIGWVLQWAAMGPLAAIRDAQSFSAADPATNRAIRSAALAAMQLFTLAEPFFVDSTASRTMLGAFVATGVITQAESDALVALGDVVQPLSFQPGQFGVPATAQDFEATR